MSESGGTGCGCLSLIIFGILLFALVFGVTIGGRHYGMSLDCSKGVVMEENVAP